MFGNSNIGGGSSKETITKITDLSNDLLVMDLATYGKDGVVYNNPELMKRAFESPTGANNKLVNAVLGKYGVQNGWNIGLFMSKLPGLGSVGLENLTTVDQINASSSVKELISSNTATKKPLVFNTVSS